MVGDFIFFTVNKSILSSLTIHKRSAPPINLIKAKKLRDEVLKLVKGKSFKTIIDFRNVSSVTTVETRKFMSNNENFNNLKLCDSFITNSYTTSMLIGFYLKIFKPAVVTKSFSTFGDALDWVEKF